MTKRKSLKVENISMIIACALFALMFAAGSAMYDHFGSVSTFLNLFNDNAYLIVVAVGITFVLLTGGIDISVSSVVAFTCVLSAYLLQRGWPAFIVIPLVLLVGLLNGFLIGYCVQEYHIQPFIITLASQFLLRGMCAVVSTVSIPIENGFYKSAALSKISFKVGRTNAKFYLYVFLALIVVFAAYYVLKYTRFGRTVYAIGSNELSAGYMGLDVKKVKIGVYMISGFCAALGGIIFSFYTLAGYSLQNMGMELDAISSAVIGGTLLTGGVGNVWGSVIGVLIQGVIQTIVTYQNLNAWWTRVTIAALLCLFIVLQRFISIRADRRKGKG